jgi:hypothetical protein
MQEAVAVSHPSLAATNGLLAEGQVRACDSGSVAVACTNRKFETE